MIKPASKRKKFGKLSMKLNGKSKKITGKILEGNPNDYLQAGDPTDWELKK